MSNLIYTHIRSIAKISRGYISGLAEENGFTLAEALVILACGSAGTCTQTEIVRYCGMDKSMITLSVKSLSRKGFLRQEKDEADKRRARVALTESGQSAFQILEKGLSIFDQGTLSSLTPGETAALESLLGKLSIYLEKYDI